MTIVRVKDLRPAGICPRARFWFEQHDLSWPDFVRHGIEAETLRGVGDSEEMVERVIGFAERREARDGQ